MSGLRWFSADEVLDAEGWWADGLVDVDFWRCLFPMFTSVAAPSLRSLRPNNLGSTAVRPTLDPLLPGYPLIRPRRWWSLSLCAYS